MLDKSAKVAVIFLAVLSGTLALYVGRYFFAPVLFAIIVGLMVLPIAKRLENYSIPPSLSSLGIVLSLIAATSAVITAIAIPLSEWTEKLPLVWLRISQFISSWRDTLVSISEIQGILSEFALTESDMKVEIDDTEAMKNVALVAPVIFGQIILFLASLYFFIGTRRQAWISVLSTSPSTSFRLRMARTFRDITENVSGYLIHITAINVLLGISTTIAMWMLDVPSPMLWGLIAGLLNYMPYVGPAFMAGILVLVGLSIGGTPLSILTPAIVFLGLNFIEANFVTPFFIGRALTINPFLIFLTLAFWIWLWGPIGGFVAVPTLLVLNSAISNFSRPNKPKLLRQ